MIESERLDGHPNDLGDESSNRSNLLNPDRKYKPFESLIAISSLLVGLLFVAGFSFRWAYYYNFGFPGFVYTLNIEAVLINAFELVRTPFNLSLCALFILLPYCILSIGLYVLRRCLLDKKGAFKHDIWQKNKSLVLDLIRALVLVILTFATGSHIGYETFKRDVEDSPSSRLPKITVVFKDKGPSYRFPLCGGSAEDVPFIGNGLLISKYSDNNEGCNSNDIVWRLFHKDNNDVYIFGSRKGKIAKGTKPTVTVIPSANISSLILNR